MPAPARFFFLQCALLFPESLFCFVFITLPQITVGGKEEKVLIYNEKNLTKLWILFNRLCATKLGRHSVSYWYLSETTRLAAMPWCPLKSANRRSEDKGWPPGMAARGESRQ